MISSVKIKRKLNGEAGKFETQAPCTYTGVVGRPTYRASCGLVNDSLRSRLSVWSNAARVQICIRTGYTPLIHSLCKS